MIWKRKRSRIVSSTLSSVPDVTTFAANTVVFLAAISAAVVGSMSAVKQIKKSIVEALKPEEGSTSVTKTQIVGGILQDQYGSVMMAEALRNNAESTDDLKTAVCQVRDELRENRHTMDRLIDALRSNANGR